MTRLIDQRVDEPRDLADARSRHRWNVSEWYSIAHDALFSHDEDGVAALAPDSSLGEAGDVRAVTFGEVQDGAARAAGALAGLGVGRGDRVAISLPPSPETAMTLFGVLAAGAVLVPLPRLLGGEAIAYRVDHAGARLLITDDAGHQKVAPHTAIEIVTALPSHEPVEPLAMRAEDPAILLYTSGTTGPPKGVLHAQRMLLGHIGVDYAFERFRPGDVYYGAADWGWMGGLLLGLLVPWANGVPIVASRADAFDPAAVIGLWEQCGVTTAFLPPTALRAMRRAGVRPTTMLRAIVTGGELPTADEKAWVRGNLSPVINNAFGQTEANALIGDSQMLGTVGDDTLGSVYPGHTVTIRDEHGTVVPDGEAGEICIELPDPVACIGYWDDPNAYAERVAGGYLHTGDVGRWALDAVVPRLAYVGRADDVIKSSGYRIGPGEIEEALASHPAVLEAVAVGIPDPVKGAVVKAYLRLSDGAEASPELFDELRAGVRGRVGAHAYPREFAVVDDFPRTETGKIQRKRLREADLDRDSERPLVSAHTLTDPSDREPRRETIVVDAEDSEGGAMVIGIRHHVLLNDESARYGGHDTGPNPVETMLGGLATASLVILRIIGGDDIPPGLGVRVEAELNVERILGAPTDDPMFARLDLLWEVPAHVDPQRIERWLPELARRRPGQALIDAAGLATEGVVVRSS